MSEMTLSALAETMTAETMAAETATTEPAAASQPAGPSIHRRAILTWVAVYPTITILQTLLGSKVAGYPLPVRTLVLTAFVAPLMTYLMLPAVLKGHAKLVHRARRGR